jgi:hypothetical protein
VRLIFSRDRPAQLDLLLRSLERYAPHEQTRIIWWASDWYERDEHPLFDGYYDFLPVDQFLMAAEGDFNLVLRRCLMECPDETVTFFCDDDVLYRKLPRTFTHHLHAEMFRNEELLTFSLRLGVRNAQMPMPQRLPWLWQKLPRHDFGFPASVDGHIFRVSDVLRLIGDDVIEHPTNLETVMAIRAEGMAEERPYMASFVQQSLVGIPVNRVSTSSGCPAGVIFPQSTLDLNRRWLAGERIVLDDVVDRAAVTGCHHEVQFRWEKRP